MIHWVATWEAALQLSEPGNLPPDPGLHGSTLRQRVRISIGGPSMRLHLSNEFGDGPMIIRSVRIARWVGGDTIDASTNTIVRFRGETSLLLAVGEARVSDDIDVNVEALSDLAITMFIQTAPRGLTGHPGSRTTSYMVAGEHVDEPSFTASVPVQHWYVIGGIDVAAGQDVGAVVVLGNSIADGRGSGTDMNNRWPDNLARRLDSLRLSARGPVPGMQVAVVNAGIGGNAVIRGGLGPTALSRLERDVLSRAGARWVIVSEGVNDIGTARGDSAAAVARNLIDAYRQIIRRAHERKLRAFGATLLPFGGSAYDSPEHEAARQIVNRWIRQSAEFDAVIDFDRVMRDPSSPTRLLPAADTGDHLHPNELGYRMMADAIDLSLFRR